MHELFGGGHEQELLGCHLFAAFEEQPLIGQVQAALRVILAIPIPLGGDGRVHALARQELALRVARPLDDAPGVSDLSGDGVRFALERVEAAADGALSGGDAGFERLDGGGGIGHQPVGVGDLSLSTLDVVELDLDRLQAGLEFGRLFGDLAFGAHAQVRPLPCAGLGAIVEVVPIHVAERAHFLEPDRQLADLGVKVLDLVLHGSQPRIGLQLGEASIEIADFRGQVGCGLSGISRHESPHGRVVWSRNVQQTRRSNRHFRDRPISPPV